MFTNSNNISMPITQRWTFQYYKMMVTIEATALALLLTLSRARSGLYLNCSEVGKCANQKACCGPVCVALGNCNDECANDSDCTYGSRRVSCVGGYCECSLRYYSCNNESIVKGNGASKLCKSDSDCSRLNAQCRNETCKTDVLNPLNPALLAIVTIFGVLMFSCMFCCCLSRMKSERRSMKSREAKGKLKSLGIEPALIANEKSSPLLKAKSQSTALQDISESSENAKTNALSQQRDQSMLISVLIETGLPPINEEDEDEEEKEKE